MNVHCERHGYLWGWCLHVTELFVFLANRETVVSPANRLPLDWPCLGLRVMLATWEPRASRWGEPRGRQEAFVTQQPKEQGASNFSTAVNIDPPAKNEGLISVWQQTSQGRGDPSRERHTCVSLGLEPDSALCVAQEKGRCSSGHFPS